MIRYRFIGYILSAYLCVCSPIRLTAQVIRLYTTQHGLKTNNCHSVDVDSRGFVWVTGANALGIFDGTKFQYLPITTEDGRSIFQMAHGVREAGNNKFWVFTTHGLFLLDAHTMHFEHIFLSAQEDSIYGYSSNSIIDYPKQDYKLVTTDGFDTYLLNTKTMKVDQAMSDRLNKVLRESFIIHPVIDKQQRLWATGRNIKLVCINLKNFQPHSFNYTPKAASIIEKSNITRLMETDEGILIGTNHGLLIYDPKENLVHEPNAFEEDLFVSAILRTHDNRILIGTDGRGIWEYKKTGEMYSISSLYDRTADFNISYGKVMDLKEDMKGNIIGAFLQKGLVVIPPQNDCFHYYAISPLDIRNNPTCITSMTIDSQGNYWVGTDGCGVFTTKDMDMATAYPIINGLRSLLVQDVKIDQHGTVWTGTTTGTTVSLEWTRHHLH